MSEMVPRDQQNLQQKAHHRYGNCDENQKNLQIHETSSGRNMGIGIKET